MAQFNKLPLLIALLLPLPALADLDTEALRQALAAADRDVNDFIRDPYRKPVEVLDFLGIEAGMTVLDLYAAGGYYTFILARAVGPEGLVYAQNTRRGLNTLEDRQDISQGQALTAKIERGGLSNVQQLVVAVRELQLAAESLDAVMLALTLHDYYNSNPDRALTLLQQLYRMLKPGGVVGLSDHVGLAGRDNRQLHRMEIQQAVSVAQQAGFRVESSELLRNPQDDHSRNIFDPALNRNTDRFLLKLIKP
jgi:predicted methyltransferase